MSEKSAIGAIVAVTCMVVVLAVFAWFVVNTISYIPNTPGNCPGGINYTFCF